MAIAGNLTLVISARVKGGEPHDIGEIELPVVTETTHSVGNVSITARVRVDEEELKLRLEEFGAAVSDEMAAATPKKRHGWMQEALAFAETGRRVAIIEPNAQELRAWFDEFVDILAQSQVARISRMNGREGIDFHSGGMLRFFSAHSTRVHQWSLDRLYVSAVLGDEEMEKLAPLVMTSEEPAIISFP